jgi:4-amino-4-deoxy-L-arabinose transferase-like glycosyltransferase
LSDIDWPTLVGRLGSGICVSFSSNRSAWRNWLLALSFVLALAAGIGLREPSPPDEPRFALAARHMVESGQWLVPRRGQEFYADKPAVFMWMQAAIYALAGNLRVAFLLPSLIGALAALWLTWDLARRLWSRRVAWYAAGALSVCLQFGLQAKRGQIDMVLVGLTTLSLWALMRYLLLDTSVRWLWVGMFAAGVGTVTKGVGFLPVLVLVPWFVLPPGLRATSAQRRGTDWIGAIVAFIAGAAVWLGPLLVTLVQTGDPALSTYTHELLFKQTAERYANAWHHVQPGWYYFQVIAFMWLPGVLLLPWLGPAWARRLRRPDPRLFLLLGWSVLVLLFLASSQQHRDSPSGFHRLQAVVLDQLT